MYYNEKTTIFLDGKWIKATDARGGLYSQTLHYGSGVFEGIRSYKTEDGPKIFKAKELQEVLNITEDFLMGLEVEKRKKNLDLNRPFMMGGHG